MRRAIDVSRWIGTPFLSGSHDPALGGVDCFGAVLLGFSAACIDVPPGASCVTEPSFDHWELVGSDARAATRLLDIVASHTDDDGVIHVGALVDLRSRHLLTAYHAEGVRLIRADRVPRVFAVYRPHWVTEEMLA